MTVRGERCGDPGKLRRLALFITSAIMFPAGYSFGQTTVCKGKEQVTTNSPWVKVVRSGAAVPGPAGTWAKNPSSPGGDRGSGGLPSPHSASLPSRTSAPKGDTRSSLAFYGRVTVRWESADPIRQRTGIAVPHAFENHYVLSVKGLPGSVLRPDGLLLPEASLSARNRQARAAEFVALTADKSTLLLAFPVFDPPIMASDKRVVFTMNLSGIRIGAKFEPKKMGCHGGLIIAPS